MKVYLIAFCGVLSCYLILDGLWLGLISKAAYLEAMEGRLRDDYPILPWVSFYLIYSAVVVHLVVIKNHYQPLLRGFIDGCLFGLAAYGAYNLTNYAILDDWPLLITLKDWLWGTFVTGAISVAGCLLVQKVVTEK